MNTLESFERAIMKIVKANMPVYVTEGEVESVDKEKNTCKVKREGLPELLNVRLNAVYDAGTNVITVYPQTGSKVLCLLVNNDPKNAYILSTTNIDEIYINGSDYSIVKSETLETELEKTNNLLSSLINVISGAPIPEPGNGSPSALQEALSTAITGMQLGDYSEIANEKIKHA